MYQRLIFDYHRVRNFSQGGNQANLSGELIGGVRVPLPDVTEQQKIAEILSTWDEAIEQTRKLIEAKKRRKKGLVQQLLTGRKRLPGFKGKWSRVTMGHLFVVVSRPLEWDDNAVYSLLSIRRRSGGVFLRERVRGAEIKTKTMFEARAGDFLISKMQVLHGATGLVPEALDGTHITGSYISLRPRDSARVDPRFFSRLSSTPEFYHLTFISSYGVHIEKMTFNLRWFLKEEVILPTDMREQAAIADRLDLVDEEITCHEAKLKALENQKRGLMQKLLTGTVRVTT
jgi:type I restriction enzyme S subunit